MLKICLGFCKSEPQYAYKRYAYKKTCSQLKLEPIVKYIEFLVKLKIFKDIRIQNFITPVKIAQQT